jgi:peptidoglycan hydrolase-like amidase
VSEYVIIIVCVIGQTIVLSKAVVSLNPYDDCPPNATANNMIWVEIIDIFSPTKETIYRHIPFDTGTITYEEIIDGETIQVEYDNYIRGVMVGELRNAEPIPDGNRWHPEMLKAMAITIRTKAYHRCGWWERDDGTRYIKGDTTQEYRYHREFYDVSEETHQDFQDTIDETKDIYLEYGGATFDVEYRDRTGLETFDNPLPHKGIYDPVGYPWGDLRKSGLPQINANYWALGDSQGTPFPSWNYLQILVHYYTGIDVVQIN